MAAAVQLRPSAPTSAGFPARLARLVAYANTMPGPGFSVATKPDVAGMLVRLDDDVAVCGADDLGLPHMAVLRVPAVADGVSAVATICQA